MMKNRRIRKLIRPDIQVRGIIFSLALALGTVVLQSITMMFFLNRVASDATTDGPMILQELPGFLAMSALVSFVLLTPLIMALTLSETHRLAGPIYRIERYLKAVIDGAKPDGLQLREQDRLQDLAGLVRRAVEVSASGAHADDEAPARERRAA